MNTHALTDWLNATCDTVSEYIGPMLGDEHSIEVNNMAYDDSCPVDAIMGSCLLLTCDNHSGIKVSFLSNDDVLMQIAKKMLGMPSNDSLEREEMKDAIKEVVNVISGGVKSRLNSQISGVITLGLPSFVDSTHSLQKNEHHLFQKITISGLPIVLSVSHEQA